jgi:cation:H+ antiporter
MPFEIWVPFLFLIGLALLVKGADFLIGGGAGLAVRLRISSAIVGFTVIAFGTSVPELSVNLYAMAVGTPDIALGNVLGSNICNIALIFALCAVLKPDFGDAGIDLSEMMRREVVLVLGATGLFTLLALRGVLDAISGIILLVGFAGILWYLARRGQNEDSGIKSHGWRDIIILLGGLASVLIGAQLMVQNALIMAESFGIPEFVIAVSLVAVGTSLPELATSLVAILRNEAGISIGNIMGSNIFNILFVMGCSPLIGLVPVNLSQILPMLVFTVAVVPLFWPNRNLRRLWGVVLLFGYFTYIALQFGIL